MPRYGWYSHRSETVNDQAHIYQTPDGVGRVRVTVVGDSDQVPPSGWGWGDEVFIGEVGEYISSSNYVERCISMVSDWGYPEKTLHSMVNTLPPIRDSIDKRYDSPKLDEKVMRDFLNYFKDMKSNKPF